VTVSDKAFDGSTLATVTSRQVDGVVSGDSVAFEVGQVRFTDALLGTNKALVVVDPLLTGVSAANYQLGDVAVVPASILNNPPVFDPFPKLVVVEAKSLQELLTARDGDLPQQTLVFRLLQAPTGVTLTASGLLQWTPRRTDIPGDYPLRVELSDGVTNVQRSGVITVAPSGIDPVVIPLPDASVVENRASGGYARSRRAQNAQEVVVVAAEPLPQQILPFQVTTPFPEGAGLHAATDPEAQIAEGADEADADSSNGGFRSRLQAIELR
jgi:hypothetical protein